MGRQRTSTKKLDELLGQLRASVEALKQFCITMQKDERPYTAKPHKNADKLTRKAYDLAKRYDVTVNNVPLEGMMNDLRLSEQIEALQRGADAAVSSPPTRPFKPTPSTTPRSWPTTAPSAVQPSTTPAWPWS